MRIPLNSPTVIPLDMSKLELRKVPEEEMARVREALGNMANLRGAERSPAQETDASAKSGGAGTAQGPAGGAVVTPTGPSAFTARTLAALMQLNEI